VVDFSCSRPTYANSKTKGVALRSKKENRVQDELEMMSAVSYDTRLTHIDSTMLTVPESLAFIHFFFLRTIIAWNCRHRTTGSFQHIARDAADE
jgi:hypothetical protein